MDYSKERKIAKDFAASLGYDAVYLYAVLDGVPYFHITYSNLRNGHKIGILDLVSVKDGHLHRLTTDEVRITTRAALIADGEVGRQLQD